MAFVNASARLKEVRGVVANKNGAMAWIDTLDESEWHGDLGHLKKSLVDPHSNQIDNILKIHSLDVSSLKAHLAIYQQAMKPTDSLSKSDREMIALVVSKINHCVY